VSGPLIPYIDGAKYEIPLGFLDHVPIITQWIDPSDPPSIKPFGTLVALGVYIGAVVTMKRAKERKLDQALMSDFIFWVVATGFVLSHVLDALFYHPDTVARDPLYLLKIWDGLSSYGGFMGAVIGAVAWRLYRKKRILEMVDVTVSAFPLAWIFGRAGCSIVHDHPGAVSDSWLAVQYPNTVCPAGYPPDALCGRFDLGLIEMVLTIPLALACWWLWKQKPLRPHGFYVAFTLVCYAPVRFALDFLRVDPDAIVFRGATDPRYGGLTPAQWACFPAIGLALYFLKRIWKQPYVPTTEVMQKPKVDGEEDDDDPAEDAVDEAKARRPVRRKKKKASKKKSPAEKAARKAGKKTAKNKRVQADEDRVDEDRVDEDQQPSPRKSG
jgi:phosphatidylglycerol:prolipoprotein diacylglycerol transferase